MTARTDADFSRGTAFAIVRRVDTHRPDTRPMTVTAVILAGGQARRMHGIDKGLLAVAGRPLIEHLLITLRGQTDDIVISANRNLAHYATYGVQVVSDARSGAQGPLAGIYRALCCTTTEYLLSVPCDTPCLPRDLVQRMITTARQQQAAVCVAHDGVRPQPVITLLHRALRADLCQYLDAGHRKVMDWLLRHNPALADFSDQPEAFVNLNTPDDCRRLELSCNTPIAC
ncbi:MAG: molybdenum cofactor guanylyltransferase MobA [Gammaproteobacteria bacterium]|nr:molybdenum cofactor guanylyltransferase MobA [Gammaproteobacteria bacterium]